MDAVTTRRRKRSPSSSARGRPVGGAWPAALAAAAALLAAAPASAQQPLAFEIRTGVGFPAFALSDRADPGAAVGLDLSYEIAPRLSLVAGGDLELLDGTGGGAGPGAGAPDVNAWHYGAGLEAQLLDPTRTYWRLSLNGGVGGTTFDVSGAGAGTETDLSVYGGLELGWSASREVELFAGVRTWGAFAGGDGPVAGPAGGDVLWSFPVTGGLRLAF